ncbi:MAG: methyltransferase domain-containing protein [Calditrichaceae bacterium]|nr:methyltransferase domain-containing protein [Calditrichaceae bacterium]MBN2710252.1 methyltransferase domain-containing protein [Calditrichaceae bacterium]RQV93875.1 MAG: class I SAM-dependent methyltransferase [Calditrichota bacterium]
MKNEKFTYAGEDLEAMSHAYKYREWVLSKIEPVIGDHVVEVGGGIGDFSEMFLHRSIKSLTIVEPSEDMCGKLNARLTGYDNVKINIINGFFGDNLSNLPKQTDTVLYINTLEHIEDYQAEINYMHKALLPGGHIGIFVPALSWLYGNFDKEVGHYRRFNKRELDEVVKRSGFTIIKSYYMDCLGVPLWWLQYRLLKRKDLKSYQVILYDKLFVPVNRFLENIITPPFGKNLLLLAKKNKD